MWRPGINLKLDRARRRRRTMEEKIVALQTRKGICGILFVGMILLLAIWILLVHNSTGIKKIDGEIYPVKNISDGYALCLDEIKCENDNILLTEDLLEISGWMIKQGEDTNNVRLRVVLRNEVTGEYLMLPTTLLQRPDVTDYYNDGHNYDVSGFEAKISQKDIDLENCKYLVMGLYFLNGEEYLIGFDRII